MNRKRGRNTDGTFAPGNPGKPSGARHRATRAVLELLDGEAEALTRKAMDLAARADVAMVGTCQAARIVTTAFVGPFTLGVGGAAKRRLPQPRR